MYKYTMWKLILPVLLDFPHLNDTRLVSTILTTCFEPQINLKRTYNVFWHQLIECLF